MLREAALSEAVANLRSQKDDLRNVRSQSAFAATVSSIIASVFTSLVSGKDLTSLFSGHTFLGMNVVFLLAVLLFMASLVFSVLVLTSVQSVVFEPNPKALLYWAEHGDKKVDGVKKVVCELTDSFAQNEGVIEEVRANLQLALIFGTCQIIPWVILVAGIDAK